MGAESSNWHLELTYDHWVALSVSGPRPSARYKHATAVVDEKLYLSGGSRNGRYLSDVQVFNLKNLAWSTLKLSTESNADETKDSVSQEILPATSGHSMFKWGNKLLLVGGHSKNIFDTVTVRFIDLESYHCGIVETSGKVPVARGGQSVTLVGSRLIMFGGEDRQRRLLNDVHVLDLETMVWDVLETTQTPPAPRFDHTAAVNAERYLLIFGGCSHSIFFNDVHVLDLQTGKLAEFRIKELKDVLNQLGLSKQGKKQDLVDRILAILSDERVSGMWAKKNAVGKHEVAKLVDDTFRKMKVSGAPDLASKVQAASDSSNVRLKEEIEDSYPTDKIRCLCGSSLQADSVIKCEDPRCQVWQHIGCVIIPEKPMEGVLPAPPDIFYCELCRLSRADPFWMTVANPLYPVKLTTTSVPTDGTNPTQSIEKTFQLTRADKDLLLKQEYDVQAWCMLLNDKVTFRMQWPQYADLQVNGVPVRAINRPSTQLLGANGRDDGPVITPFTRDGINKISLTGCDSRVFILGVRIVKRRTVQQILNLIPKESDDEQFEEALSRVRRCVGGGTEMENADSDSDLEIVADFIPVNLRCPMSGLRMKVAGRFKPCLHMGCFDLEVFVEMNQRSRKWQCPICLKNYCLENIIIDPYFNLITSKMQNCGEDVADIEVKPDGSWRAKAESDRRELGDLGMWHFPDGTLCAPMNEEVKSRSEAFKNVKQEGVSEGHANLKLGIRKNRNGLWEVSKPEDLHALSSCNRLEKFENNGHNVIPMSSSAMGSGRDGDDASVNQDGGGNFDFSTNNGIELDSMSLNIDHTYGFNNHNSTPLGNAEVIVLSDSEEENDVLISSVYKNNQTDTNGVAFPLPQHGIPDPYPEEPALGTGASSCLGLFNTNDDEFGMPIWSLPPGSQAGPNFQLFGSDVDVSDALLDLQHGSINCPTSMNDYSFTLEPAMGSTGPVPESSIDHSNADLNDRLINNPLPFGGDDPPLQIFLPTRPSDALMQPNLRDQPDVSEDWVSLRLGGGGTSGQSAAANGVKSQQQLQSKERPMDSLTDTASLLLGMNDNRSGKTSRERSDSPFPRQRRTVKRFYLSIDSDSD